MGWGWVVVGWLEGSLGGWVCGGMGDDGVGGWRVHGVGAYTHPSIKSYNVKIFIYEHPPTHPSNISKVSLCHYTYTLDGSWGRWVGGVVSGWRVHGVGSGGVDGWRVYGWVVGGFMGWMGVWWCGWLVGEFMGWKGVGGGGVGGWRVHRVGGGVGGSGMHGGVGGWRVYGVGACTHPHMNIYNVKRFNFMNTQPPIKHIQSVTLLLYIYSPTHEQL